MRIINVTILFSFSARLENCPTLGKPPFRFDFDFDFDFCSFVLVDSNGDQHRPLFFVMLPITHTKPLNFVLLEGGLNCGCV